MGADRMTIDKASRRLHKLGYAALVGVGSTRPQPTAYIIVTGIALRLTGHVYRFERFERAA
jgi:hypothetical protein